MHKHLLLILFAISIFTCNETSKNENTDLNSNKHLNDSKNKNVSKLQSGNKDLSNNSNQKKDKKNYIKDKTRAAGEEDVNKHSFWDRLKDASETATKIASRALHNKKVKSLGLSGIGLFVKNRKDAEKIYGKIEKQTDKIASKFKYIQSTKEIEKHIPDKHKNKSIEELDKGIKDNMNKRKSFIKKEDELSEKEKKALLGNLEEMMLQYQAIIGQIKIKITKYIIDISLLDNLNISTFVKEDLDSCIMHLEDYKEIAEEYRDKGKDYLEDKDKLELKEKLNIDLSATMLGITDALIDKLKNKNIQKEICNKLRNFEIILNEIKEIIISIYEIHEGKGENIKDKCNKIRIASRKNMENDFEGENKGKIKEIVNNNSLTEIESHAFKGRVEVLKLEKKKKKLEVDLKVAKENMDVNEEAEKVKKDEIEKEIKINKIKVEEIKLKKKIDEEEKELKVVEEKEEEEEEKLELEKEKEEKEKEKEEEKEKEKEKEKEEEEKSKN